MTKASAIRNAKADAYVTSLKGAVKTAFSLESILAFVTKSLLGASAGTAKFQKSLNVSYGTAYMMQREFQAMEFSMMSNFITSEKLSLKSSGNSIGDIPLSAEYFKLTNGIFSWPKFTSITFTGSSSFNGS